MADKYRISFPIAVTFTDGELPTAAKLSSIGRQAKSGLNLMEYAVGDVWNQGGDALLALSTNNRLLIPSIGRFLGSTRNLSPRIPTLASITLYSYQVTSSDVGLHECTLTFPAHSASTFSWSGTAAPGATPKASLDLVVASTDWYINKDTGWCYFYDVIGATWKLEYKPVVEGDINSSSTFNVIPDPNQGSYNFGGVKIQFVNGTNSDQGYYIFLPPRGPLGTRSTELTRRPQDDLGTPSHSSNFGDPAAGEYKFWHIDTVGVSAATVLDGYAQHYRYNLPKFITNSWSSGSSIPAGTVYLYDPSYTGTIIEGLTFVAETAGTPRTYLLVASGTGLDSWLSSYGTTAGYSTAVMQSSSQITTYYPSNGLRLITVGQDVSSLVSQLLVHFLNHDHSTASSMPRVPIKHSALTGLTDNSSGTPQITQSTLTGDNHPQYLHRHGTQVTARDKFGNAMLGDFRMASSAIGSGDYKNLSANSRGIYFGTEDGTGPKLYYSSSQSNLTLEHTNAGGQSGLVIKNGSGTLSLKVDGASGQSYLTGSGYLNVSGVNSLQVVTPVTYSPSRTVDIYSRYKGPIYNCHWTSGGGSHEWGLGTLSSNADPDTAWGTTGVAIGGYDQLHWDIYDSLHARYSRNEFAGYYSVYNCFPLPAGTINSISLQLQCYAGEILSNRTITANNVGYAIMVVDKEGTRTLSTYTKNSSSLVFTTGGYVTVTVPGPITVSSSIDNVYCFLGLDHTSLEALTGWTFIPKKYLTVNMTYSKIDPFDQ